MKKIIIIVCIFLLTGCFDYVEINDLAIIGGLLIDYENNEYKITSQIIDNNINVYTTNGKSIDECLNKLSKLLNKDIFLSHLKVLLLTDNTIINNVDYIDYFLRETKSKMNFYVYYVNDNYKNEIFNIYKEEKVSLYLLDMTNINKETYSSSSTLTFLDLVYKKQEKDIDIIYPNIEIKNNNDKKILYLNNNVSFKNNNKIVFNDLDTIIFNLLTNNINNTILNIPCENDYFSIKLNSSNTTFKYKKNEFTINTKLNTKLNSYNCKYDLDKPNTTKILSNHVNSYVKENVYSLVNKCVNSNLDIIGIKNYIYKHHKKKVNIDDLIFKTTINTTITSIGEMRK